MKALFFSPKDGSTTFRQDLVAILKKTKPEIIFLPGHLSYHPPLSFFKRISVAHNVYILIEYARKRSSQPVLIFKGKVIQIFPVQHLETSRDYAEIKTLHTILPSRVFLKKYLLLMCGEINAFDVRGSMKANGPPPKYKLVVDVVHTNMAHWNHLLKKYKALSTRKRWSVHITNNTCKSLNTSLRIFYDGNEVNINTYQTYAGQRYACINV